MRVGERGGMRERRRVVWVVVVEVEQGRGEAGATEVGVCGETRKEGSGQARSG